jgi:5-(carboxyamino)imidazole ribonucleotide synthase
MSGAPSLTVGILGGGQLARMLALAAARIGLRTVVFDPAERAPAAEVAGGYVRGAFDDEAALARFADRVDVITYEFENVPAETAAFLAARRPVRPGAKDRLIEKTFVRGLGVDTPAFSPVDGPGDLDAAVGRIGLPAVLKTRRLGYDGKGQVVLRAAADLDIAWDRIGAGGAQQAAILEALIPFEAEISILVVRGAEGDFALYDPCGNRHWDGILRTTTVPAPVSAVAAANARRAARQIAEAIDYVGLLAVEFFVIGDQVLVNEMAPRVHNSGHWTLEACVCSQFENHMRAVAGWPLGVTARHSDAEMINLIGDDVNRWRALLAEPGAALHLYGKGEARPGRKMGHVTRLKPLSA